MFILGTSNSWEVHIDQSYTVSGKFITCSNTKCRVIFECNPLEIQGEEDFLCPRCRNKIETHHIVQCINCETIIDFIEAEPSEEPVVFSVKKCSKCSGTKEDERHITAYYFPDAFM